MQPPPDENGAGLLVLRVWRDPAFRARITWGEADEEPAQTLVKSDPAEVADFVAQWLEQV